MTDQPPKTELLDPATFYDELADGYDEQFDAPHRRAYDDLCWEYVNRIIGDRPALSIVDVGCGVGRWAGPLADRGHQVVGVEPSAAMVNHARRRSAGRYAVHHCGVDEAQIDPESCDLVIAMGSVQYAPDPTASIARMASWLRPHAHLVVLVDSLVGLVAELLRRDDVEQAMERLATRTGIYRDAHGAASHLLYDAHALRRSFESAHLDNISVHGLLVDWSVRPRDDAHARLVDQHDQTMATERALAEESAVADLGKQLLAIGRKPSS